MKNILIRIISIVLLISLLYLCCSCRVVLDNVTYSQIDSSSFFYSQLSDNEKLLYTSLLSLDPSINELEIHFSNEMDTVEQLQSAIQNVWDAIRRDHPEIYGLAFDSNGLQYSVQNGTALIENIYLSDATLLSRNEIQTLISPYLCDSLENRCDIILSTCNSLLEVPIQTTSSEGYPSNSIYDVLVNHQGNCFGIALTIKLLCDQMGIPCLVVSGTNDTGKQNLHAWNYIQLEDGSFYLLDLTHCISFNESPKLYGSRESFKDRDIVSYYSPDGNLSQQQTKVFSYPILAYEYTK